MSRRRLHQLLLAVPIALLVAGALWLSCGLAWWSALAAFVALLAAAQLFVAWQPSRDESGTRLMSMPAGMLALKERHIEEDLVALAASLELQRSVFEASAELVSCVDECDARERFVNTMSTYWSCERADLFLWERGEWRCIGDDAGGPEPLLTAAVRLPGLDDPDLLLDLSPGVDGQAALILRGARPQPTIAERSPADHRYIAEVLRGLLALSLRRVLLYQRLQNLGRIDPLTTLFRRWYGERRLHELVERGHVVSVAILDIDHFKTVNDSYGHAAGDAVLRHLGRHVRQSLRTGDICCRYGGEEFLVVLPEASGDTALRVADRIRSSIEHLDNLPCTVTVSIGIASCQEEESVEQLISRADQALYKAKNGGRNQVVEAPLHLGSGELRIKTRFLIDPENEDDTY